VALARIRLASMTRLDRMRRICPIRADPLRYARPSSLNEPGR
jgi:hypothetical protein